MAKEKTDEKGKGIFVKIYPEEIEGVSTKVMTQQKLLGEDLGSRDVRTYFGLTPTHRRAGVKSQLKLAVSELSEEEQKELLEKIQKKKEE